MKALKELDFETLRNIALKFAVYHHKDQKRKYTNTSYIEHPVAVSSMLKDILQRHGHCANYKETIIAAILHDVIEDTTATREDIDKIFGYIIGDLVFELTDYYTSERFPFLNRTERKQLEALGLRDISINAQCIKMCDIIDNTKSIVAHDPKFALIYLGEIESILESFRCTKNYYRDSQNNWVGVHQHLMNLAQDCVKDGWTKLESTR